MRCLDRRLRTKFVVIPVRSCLDVQFRGNCRTFRVAGRHERVLYGNSRAFRLCSAYSMFIFRGNSRTFGLAAMGVNGFEQVFRGNYRTFWCLQNFFDVHFSWYFSYFSVVWDCL